jgi:hypothetical protein
MIDSLKRFNDEAEHKGNDLLRRADGRNIHDVNNLRAIINGQKYYIEILESLLKREIQEIVKVAFSAITLKTPNTV